MLLVVNLLKFEIFKGGEIPGSPPFCIKHCSCRNMSVRDACTKIKSFYCQLVNDQIRLKKSHHYYYQVQGAMAMADVKWYDFIVWTTNDMNIEKITFDQIFWDLCYSKLKSIYRSFYPRSFTLESIYI